MSDPLRLYVFDPDEGFDEELPASARTPADWLAAPPPWRPDPQETLLWLDGLEPPLLLGAFGRLHALAAQLDEAADRLAAGQRALVRSAMDGAPTWLALEPDGDEVLVSALAELPRPLASYYPTAATLFDPLAAAPVDQRAALHAYVDAHRAELVARREQGGLEWRVQGLRWPREATLAALRAHAAGAAALDRHLDAM